MKIYAIIFRRRIWAYRQAHRALAYWCGGNTKLAGNVNKTVDQNLFARRLLLQTTSYARTRMTLDTIATKYMLLAQLELIEDDSCLYF